MLTELHIEQLGVIDRLDLVLGHGLTALTGETGAGKTMLVEAISLLVGGRAEGTLVRPGAAEARIEGRFVVGDDEVVLARVIPADAPGRTSTAASRRSPTWPRREAGSSTSTASTATRACCPASRSALPSTGSAPSISRRSAPLGPA